MAIGHFRKMHEDRAGKNRICICDAELVGSSTKSTKLRPPYIMLECSLRDSLPKMGDLPE